MAPSETTKTAASRTKKEKIFHPASRKAEQLARKALRKGKLGNLTSKRSQKHDTRGECCHVPFTSRAEQPTVRCYIVDFYGFFFHALPEEGALTLGELHTLIRDVWLTRHDEELEQGKAARRKDRPKSVRETKLEDIKLIEAEQYRTGIGESIYFSHHRKPALTKIPLSEVPDVTHTANVDLFRQWDQKELAYVQQLRHIRIFSQQPGNMIVSQPGKHQFLIRGDGDKQESMLIDIAS